MFLQDLKYAIRGVIKRPGFSFVVIATLAVGIGANVAIFSAVRAVLLRPLPFPEPDRLLRVYSSRLNVQNSLSTMSPPDFVDYRRDVRAFDELAAINAGTSALSGDGPSEAVSSASVTGGFFKALGVAALRGRAMTTEDDAVGASDVAVLGHRLWMRRFGGDPSVVGKTVVVEGVARRIVGIMPPGFSYPLGSELWIPERFTAQQLATLRGAHYLDVIGRLAPGRTMQSAEAELNAIGQRLAQEYPRTNRDYAVAVVGLRDALVGDVRLAMLVLLGAVGFVFLIVCANVASLFLTRALGRTRELAIRSALGAGRGRLANGLLVESLVFATFGAVGGVLLAWLGAGAIGASQRQLGIPLLDETRIDLPVVLFAMLIAAAAALLFGTLPGWLASRRLDVAGRIRQEGGSVTGDSHRQRLRAALIVAEMALAVVLLVGAGLLMKSFVRLSSVELGFETSRIQTFGLSLPNEPYAQPAQRAAFYELLLSRISGLADVEAAGATFGLPLTDFRYSISTSIVDGHQLSDDEQDRASLQVRVVTHDYLRAMGIPVVRGRGVGEGDRKGAERVALVNESAARMLWPDQDPLGHSFEIGTRLNQGGTERAGGTVIGVVRDIHDFGPAASVRATVYFAFAQFPMDYTGVVVRTRREPSAVLEPVRAIVGELDPSLAMFRVRTMEQLADEAVAQPRVYTTLLAIFAGVAVFLAAIGIYGVLAHIVSQRTREIGIRLALGAARRDVIGMVLRQASVLAASGLAIGAVLALAATRLMNALLFGTSATDAATYGLVALAFLLVALAASWLPARRAAGIDPVRALKYE